MYFFSLSIGESHSPSPDRPIAIKSPRTILMAWPGLRLYVRYRRSKKTSLVTQFFFSFLTLMRIVARCALLVLCACWATRSLPLPNKQEIRTLLYGCYCKEHWDEGIANLESYNGNRLCSFLKLPQEYSSSCVQAQVFRLNLCNLARFQTGVCWPSRL